MSSELELLRQRITELEAENAELRKENTEIPDLRNKLLVFDAEIAELKRRNTEALRANEEYIERRDAENAKLKARIEELESEFRDRITKVEQKQTLQSALTANDNSSNNNSSNFNLVAVPEAITVPTNSAKRLNGKSLEEKEMDSFLLEAHKKIVSSEIKRHNKEKKLLRESACLLINSKPEDKVSCAEKGDQTGSSPSSSLENKHISSHSSSQEPSPSPVVRKIPYNQKVEQGIIQEVISFIQKRAPTSPINILESREIETVPADGEGRDLAQLFSDAKVAEGRTLEAKRKELVCWYNYSESYQNKVAEICSKTGVAEKTAKSQVYAMIKASLPNVSDSNLYKKTERAGSVYKLFGKIIDPATKKEVMGIGIDKVYGISYGVRGISELSNAQILYIINRVAEKARDILTNGQEQNHVTENSETSEKSLPIPEENSSLSASLDDYINMLTGSLDDETANWGTPYEDEARVEKEEVNEVKGSLRIQSDNENLPSGSEEKVDHDSAPFPFGKQETNDDSDNDSEEEMPDESDDDGYNDYGGYNEYGERDRGYYYRDGRYERKTSPMMSPIISPVTA